MFKVGDIVQRIRNEDAPAHRLVVGAVYTVSEVDGGLVRVVGEDGAWFIKNFVLAAQPKPEIREEKQELPLPLDSELRKRFPLWSGLMAYFPSALAQVSNHSFEGNEKHNPGLPLQHARGKSGDHADCILRHLTDAYTGPFAKRTEELRALCWRSLALLQEHCESINHVAAPAATFPPSDDITNV